MSNDGYNQWPQQGGQQPQAPWNSGQQSVPPWVPGGQGQPAPQSQPSAPQWNPSASSQPSAPAWGGAPAGPTWGTPGHQPPPQPPRRSPLVPILIGVLVLALTLGGIWVATRKDKPAADPSTTAPSASTTAPSTETSSSEPSASESETSEVGEVAPGPGNVNGVLAHLKEQGFRCIKEEQTLIASHVCTRYDESPAMFVYVGGTPSGKLGRIGLDVQSSRSVNVAKALSAWLINQFVTPADVSKVQQVIASGTPNKYAEGNGTGYEYMGANDGSIVMYADNFPKERPEQPAFNVPVENIRKVALSRKMLCVPDGSAITCTRAVGAQTIKWRVRAYRSTDAERAASIGVVVEGKGKVPETQKILVGETQALFGGDPEVLKQMMAQIPGAPEEGFTHHVGGLMFDYVPAYAQVDGAIFGSVFLRAPCWSGQNGWC